MNETIRISAVIPAYDRENTIARAIDSVLAQEYPALEIIVVDDGSKDHTREIVETYGGKVRYVYQENSGVAAARNRGVYEAKSEWIAFLDSDDYWLPHHLRQITDVMLITKGKAAIYFSDIMRPIDEGGGTHWDLCEFNIPGRYELRLDATEWAVGLKRHPMIIDVSVIRREKYLEMGGIPEILVTREDTFLFYWLFFFWPVCAVSGCGAVISSDCKQSGRLTAVYDARTSKFHECTKLLYQELLRYSDKMSCDQRKTIKEDIVQAHLDFGRLLLKRNKIFDAMGNVAMGVRISPLVAITRIINMLKTYCLKNMKQDKKSANCGVFY